MYDTKKLLKKSKKIIKDKKLVFFYEVATMLGISRSTLYKHFPVEGDEYEEIENLLMQNRVEDKITIRDKLMNSDNPTAWTKLYRILSEPEELAKLNADIDRFIATQPEQIKAKFYKPEEQKPIRIIFADKESV